MLALIELDRARQAQAAAALRRPAAARRAGPGADQPAAGAAARRAARRARPQAAPADADRAQAHPDRGRPHVRPRDPRPGGGHDHGRHRRGHERRQGRAARCARGPLREPARPPSSPTSSASRTSSTARSPSAADDGYATVDVHGQRVRLPGQPGAHRRHRRCVGVRPGEAAHPVPRRRRGRATARTACVASSPTRRFIGVSTAVPRRHAVGPGAHRLRAEHAAATSGSCRARASTSPGTRTTPSRSTRPGRRRRRRDRRGRRGARPRGSRFVSGGAVAATAASSTTSAAPTRGSDRGQGRRHVAVDALPPAAPGMLWLAVFFVVPIVSAARHVAPRPARSTRATPSSSRAAGRNYADASSTTGRSSCARSSTPGSPRVFCLALAYPLAYFIAFQVRAWKEPDARARHRAVLHQLPDPHAGLAARSSPTTAGRAVVNSLHITDLLTLLHLTDDGRVLVDPVRRGRSASRTTSCRS